MTANLYIGLTKSDLSPQNRVAWSDNRQTFSKTKCTPFLLQNGIKSQVNTSDLQSVSLEQNKKIPKFSGLFFG